MNENNNLINISGDPFIIFDKWFKEAEKQEINDPNAMNLATVDKNDLPTSRIVLLKSYDDRGFVFYTNEKSKKGSSINSNPYVALNFHWKSIKKQIRIEGVASKISSKETDDYFKTRPFESKIGAWASQQSNELRDRAELEERIENYKKKFSNKLVDRPSYWVGFRVKPILIEFWEEKPFRLHMRLQFTKKNNNWIAKNLYP